jgi:transposase InsO family protein
MTRKRTTSQDAHERDTEIALFRYGLIAQLIHDPPSGGEEERLLSEMAAKTFTIPHSTRTRVGISTLRRYLKLYRQGGFDALRPHERKDARQPRTIAEDALKKAIALREEKPSRTTQTIVDILRRDPSLKPEQIPNVHTLTTHLRQLGKSRYLLAHTGRVYKRFEREHVNSLWQGDAMVGPWLPDPSVPGKKMRAYLFCYIDDHSRLVPYAEFFRDEVLPRMERVLKVGILRRGLPLALYVDQGKVYSSGQFDAACASLGIRRIQAAPYSPQAKGKIERFFKTVRLQFLPEVEASNITTLDELNESLWAWLECVYHTHVHSETEQTPLARYQAGLENVHSADPELLRKAFLWRERRKVRRDATFSLQGNSYQVEPHLCGRTLELLFDPFDLSHIELFLEKVPLGKALVITQGRQRHVSFEHLATDPEVQPKPKSSLDYLTALRNEYQTLQQKQAGQLQFAKLLPIQEE